MENADRADFFFVQFFENATVQLHLHRIPRSPSLITHDSAGIQLDTLQTRRNQTHDVKRLILYEKNLFSV